MELMTGENNDIIRGSKEDDIAFAVYTGNEADGMKVTMQ